MQPAKLYVLYLCSLYGVVVVTGRQLNNTPVEIITVNNGSLPPPYPGQDGVYTAAVYTRPEDVPTIFVVGNNMITRGPDGTEYVNRGLSENTVYGIFYYIRLQSDGAPVSKTASQAIATSTVLMISYIV